jgi:fumarate reductase subunit D
MQNVSSRAYDLIQGILSYVVLLSLVVAGIFTAEYYSLLNAMDLSDWGKQFLVPFFTTAWIIFGVAVIAKAWGAWVQYRFWYALDLAKALRRLADRVDPR